MPARDVGDAIEGPRGHAAIVPGSSVVSAAVDCGSYAPLMAVRRRWRDYRTAGGRRPVKEFLDGLTDGDAAAIAAAMKDV